MNLIVFDIDDTLTESAELHQKFFVECLNAFGSAKKDYDFSSYKHHTDSFIFREIYTSDIDLNYTKGKLVEFESMMMRKFRVVNVSEIPSSVTFIDTVTKNENYGLCFATGSLQKPAEYKLESLGIDYRNTVLSCSNCNESREGIVKEAILKSKLKYDVEFFEKITVFGDGIWDLKTAENLSLDFYGIGKKNKRLLLDNGCKSHSDDFVGVTLEGL